MIGILRNTLRHVGTARYATKNSAKYLPSRTITNSLINNSLPLLEKNYCNSNESNKLHNTQAEKKPTNFWTTIRAAVKKIPIFANEEVKTSNIGYFKVSLGNGKVGLITTPKKFFGRNKLIFPATFSTELNGKPIEPESNKIADEQAQTSFKLDKWNVSLDSGKLTLKLEDSGETFILKHTVYAKVLEKSPKIPEAGGVIQTPPKIKYYIDLLPAKISSIPEGSEPLEHSYLPGKSSMTMKEFKRYGYEVAVEDMLWATGEITDRPDDFGKMKLQFPMTVLLEGGAQEIETTDDLNTLTVHHSFDMEVKKVLAKNLKKEIADKNVYKRSNIGLLLIQLESGDLIIEPKDPNGQRIFMKQEVNIEIDLDGKIPSIQVQPNIKRLTQLKLK